MILFLVVGVVVFFFFFNMCTATTQKGKKCKKSPKKHLCWMHKAKETLPPPPPLPPSPCSATLKNGKPCKNKAKYEDKCGVHAPKRENSGTGTHRCKGIEEFKNTYMANVSGSSKDTGAWKTFWEKHSKQEFPKTCRFKDCERKATCTGHMYKRDDKDGKKYNYLVPICSHHNSVKYNAPNYQLAKKTTIAVKILENTN